ncbi:hypothetical protein A6A04_05210 [Paramagnetospirillum marisnigri]|uniref:Histidine kinase/HSP90-like ATPase domain-containing protein n=1 Tax=Paramagnetospirillum marisnigri TaxID=1285242 RepID=A0A178MJG5_9PROT|nr:ATP-binding protein [Paramagnetospirillum marisnigri]OAN48154.1 hypothetical protein A6A04_05210 [Paramagnetospirillum marisnigri]
MSGLDFLNLGVAEAEFDRIRRRMLDLNRSLSGRRMVAVFDGRAPGGPAASLTQTADIFIDASCDGHAAFELPTPADLVIRVSTLTAIDTDLSDALVAAVNARGDQRLHSTDMDIRCAVQEAIGNAVIHGNLGLDGSMRADLAGLRIFAEAMEKRRGDPARACLPVTIITRTRGTELEVSIEDRGRGFSPPLTRPTRPPPVAAGGLGLVIIHRCCSKVGFGLGGRRITMTFSAAP